MAKNKLNIWQIFLLQVPQTWECDMSGEGVEIPRSTPPPSLSSECPGRCFYQPHCLATNTHTNMQLKFSKTSQHSRRQFQYVAVLSLSLLKNMFLIFDHPYMMFFQPQGSESHNNRAGGEQEGLYCVNASDVRKMENSTTRKLFV